jgi:hypothetical protein
MLSIIAYRDEVFLLAGFVRLEYVNVRVMKMQIAQMNLSYLMSLLINKHPTQRPSTANTAYSFSNGVAHT